MPRLTVLFPLFLGLSQIISAQSDTISYFVEKEFLIIGSSKSYEEAITIAKNAAEKLQIAYIGNGAVADSVGGLTYPKDTCEKEGWTYPCYVPRGRWDDGIFISVDFSNFYHGFKEGFYIVIAGSGYKNSQELKKTLHEIKKTYSDCYLKFTKVYMGCMH